MITTTSFSTDSTEGLPGVGLGGGARAGEDLVEAVEGLLVEGEVQAAGGRGELVDGARADDGGGDAGAAEHPGHGDVGGVGAQLGAQVLVGADGAAVALQLGQ